HPHAHGEVLALDVAGRDVLGVRVAPTDFRPRAETLRRAVARLALGRGTVHLDELREVDVLPEAGVDGRQVRMVSVCRELDAVREPTGKVLHEVPRAPGIARAYMEARDELRVRVDGDPGPDRPDEVLVLAVR